MKPWMHILITILLTILFLTLAGCGGNGRMAADDCLPAVPFSWLVNHDEIDITKLDRFNCAK